MALGTRRRSRRSSIDIWPGFVDALAQLLMVIIFVLLVFTAGQFLLSDALSGRDKALAQLQQQVNELSDLLAVEKRTGTELREGAASLTTQLQAAMAERDTLATRLGELAARADQEAARANEATGKLRDAEATVAADKEKVELQLKELESLRRDIEALKTVRAELEAKVASLAASQQQNAPEAGALRDRSKELEARLTSEQERTALAQKEITDRDIRLRDLGERAGKAEAALSAEQQTSQAARRQVERADRRDRRAARSIVQDRRGARRFRRQGQGTAGPDRRTRQKAQPRPGEQGRGAGALSLGVLRHSCARSSATARTSASSATASSSSPRCCSRPARPSWRRRQSSSSTRYSPR